MSIISGPVGTLLLAVLAIVGLVLWLKQDRRHRGPRLDTDDDGIDHEQLEAAEREVRDLELRQRPEEGFAGDDWGPGAGRPRPPERL